jgi:CHAT domain-containing protein/tetratricopeptide (TPR) repeat protein
MDEHRQQAYLTLIEQLLSSANGEESSILQQNSELVDAGLLAVMEKVTVSLEQQGNSNAARLRKFSDQLLALLTREDQSMFTDESSLQASLAFLAEVLQKIGGNPEDTKQVYLFLAEHQHQLDESLLQALPIAANRYFKENANQSALVAYLFACFGNLIANFPMEKRWLNMELTRAAYQLALKVFTREAFPEDWANTQINLANAYCYRIHGERAANLEQAISAYQLALQVFTRETFPQQWATTQDNLAKAYCYRIHGERAGNLEQAINACQLALQVYTREAFPEDWANTQINLANAYCDRIHGERAANLEQALSAYQLALQVFTRETFPQQWATTQDNLAKAYCYRIHGERAANLEQAISAYQLALQVFTHEAFPEDWANTQINLANAYCDRIQGERAENLEQAINACQLALQVYTREAFPKEWVTTQNNLANAYANRIRGDRADNLEQAISAYQLALQIRNREAFPEDWANTQMCLANACVNRILGDRADNLEQAIATYLLTLQVFTREAFPDDWAKTQMNLASAYRERIRGDRADNVEQAILACQLALQVNTPEAFPERWAGIQNNLANAYVNRIRGDLTDNLELAICAYQASLEIYRPESFPNSCRRTARSLGNLHFERHRWKEALTSYQQALQAAEVLYQSAIFIESQAAELSETADLHHRAAYAMAKAGDLQSAVLTLEQGRARGLSEALARDRADLEQLQVIAPDEYERYHLAAVQLRQLEDQQRTRGSLPASERYDVTPDYLRNQVAQTRQDLAVAIADIRQVPGYHDFLTTLNFDDLIGAIPADIPLVYLVTTSAGSLALIVHPPFPSGSGAESEFSIIPIWLHDLDQNSLDQLLSDWFNSYDQKQADSSAWFAAIDQVTAHLWDWLMGLLVHQLITCGVQKAILIPTGYLGLLPLHAAWAHDSTAPTGRCYAFDVIHFTYAPNASSLKEAQHVASRIKPDSLLAIDDPNHTGASPLPNSEQEIDTALATFSKHQRLRHDQATTAAVLAALPHHTVLHFSCHGFANLMEPLNSGLAMANDDFLTLRDILSLNLKGVRLAVLSACETSLTGTALPDEVVSLPVGLLQSGVAGIVASLWSVSDLSTMILITRFYDLWRNEGLEIDQALYQAQQWLRDTTNGEKVGYFKTSIPELGGLKLTTNTANFLYQSVCLEDPNTRDFAHPFHWAAFCYTGV